MPDKKDLFAGVPEESKQAASVPATTPAVAKNDLFVGVPEESTQPSAPAQPTNSATTSMQAVNQQVSSDSYAQDLQAATQVMSRYLGAGFGTPEAGHKVSYAGKTEKGNLAVDTYNTKGEFKRNVLSAKQSNQLQPQDNSSIVNPQKIQSSPTDADIDSARPVIKNEVSASSQYVGNFINENLQDLSKYPLFPGQLQGDKTPGPDGIFSPQNISNKILDHNGDVQTLSNFSNSAFTLLQQKQTKELADLETRFPIHPATVSNAAAGGGSPAYRENEDQYQQERKQIEDKYDSQRQNLLHAVSSLAQLKVANQFIKQKGPNANVTDKDMLDLGLQYAKAIGTPNIDREIQYSRDNRLTPEEKVYYQSLGGRALQYKMMESAGNGEDAIAKDLSVHVSNYQQKILDANPEFVKQQVVDAISDKLYKDKQAATPEAIHAAGQELGIRPQDYANISPDDIKTNSNVFQDIGKGFHETTAPITEFFIRHIATPFHNLVSVPVNNMIGRDAGTHIVDKEDLDQLFDNNWYDNTWLGKQVLGGPNPNAASLFGNPTQVQSNASAPDYLMGMRNPEAGKFQPSFSNITGTIANGIGQLAGFVGASGEISKGLQGAKIVTNAATADKVATAATMYLTGIDNNLKEAEQAIPGTTDDDKLKQTLLAHLYTLSDIAGFEVLTPLELKNKIFYPTSSSGQELIDIIKNDGINGLTKRNKLAKLFIDGAKEAGVDWAKMTGGATAGQVGRLFADMALAPEKVKNEDVSQEILQNATTMGIINLIPTGMAGFSKAHAENSLRNSLPYEVGSNPRPYMDAIQNMMDNGNLSEQQGNQHLQLVNMLSNIVNNVPDESLVNGNKLSLQQKQQYANNLLQEAYANTRKEHVNDAVQIQQMNDYVKNLQKERLDILNNASDFKAFNDNLFSVQPKTKQNEESNREGAQRNDASKVNPGEGQQAQNGQGNDQRQQQVSNGPLLANEDQGGGSSKTTNSLTTSFVNSPEAATPSLISENKGVNKYGFEEETPQQEVEASHQAPAPIAHLYEMNANELGAYQKQVSEHYKNAEKEIFGDNYEEWKKQKKIANSDYSTPDQYTAAEKKIEELEKNLTQAQKNILNGIGDKNAIDPQEISYYKRAVEGVEKSSNEEALGEEIAKHLVALNAAPNDVNAMNEEEKIAFAAMRAAKEKIESSGFDASKVMESALKKAYSRFPDPADAEFMLSKYFDLLKNNRNATKESNQQNEVRNQQRSIGEHQGTIQGQPEIGQRQGGERQATQQAADNSNSGERSQESQKEVSSLEHLNKLDKLQESLDSTKTSKVKTKREKELKSYTRKLPENLKQVLDNEDQIVNQLKDQQRLKVEC